MSDFSSSRWSEPAFSREYLDNAQAYVPFRGEMLSVIVSYYAHFLADGTPRRILDLGCGDGIVARALLASDGRATAVLVDGSADMLDEAAGFLGDGGRASFILSSFQRLMADDPIEETFHLVVSSLAIHHLTSDEKRRMYDYIFGRLVPGGCFLHLDAVLAPSAPLEEFSMRLWQEWVDRQREAGLTDQDFSDITRRYQDNEDNRPDTLGFHLDALRASGFEEVDCLYKHGTFALWCGRKPEGAGARGSE